MRIAYAQNPLETTVELDEADRRILRLKLVIEDHRERLAEAAFYLEPKRLDIDRVRAEVAWDAWSGEKLDQAVEEGLKMAEAELQGTHIGDCTCVPCSCTKCWAEGLLGIDTIPGLGKHQASHISAAFPTGTPTALSEVIAKLENYLPVRGESWERHPQADFDRCVPRWTEQARQAAAWLREYARQHLQDGCGPEPERVPPGCEQDKESAR